MGYKTLFALINLQIQSTQLIKHKKTENIESFNQTLFGLLTNIHVKNAPNS